MSRTAQRRGEIDERPRAFSAGERRIAELLAAEGRTVVAVAADPGAPSRADALVDGVPTAFESLVPGATAAVVRTALSRAARHAAHAVLDARRTGLSGAAARSAITRFRAAPHSERLVSARVVGDNFDLAG
ncbi:hypothetical protein [Bailinhaonella thermotolerans]|uniref:tRNA nuclease CdiA C-terminal domain-containing protein n=1 Tax=Bailinhaonella thermotolerans TaxID=1070861 RepID=A0A3A4AYG8_9ACTN|nr:hypothetical protein [Bailinhaonella thermotolerans]RJL32546.1 hypothetical protein D5H75_13565 [Bailinhaonella thermotolerans]